MPAELKFVFSVDLGDVVVEDVIGHPVRFRIIGGQCVRAQAGIHEEWPILTIEWIRQLKLIRPVHVAIDPAPVPFIADLRLVPNARHQFVKECRGESMHPGCGKAPLRSPIVLPACDAVSVLHTLCSAPKCPGNVIHSEVDAVVHDTIDTVAFRETMIEAYGGLVPSIGRRLGAKPIVSDKRIVAGGGGRRHAKQILSHRADARWVDHVHFSTIRKGLPKPGLCVSGPGIV